MADTGNGQLKGPATAFLRNSSLANGSAGVAHSLPAALVAFEASLRAHLVPQQCSPKLASYLFFPFSQFLQVNPTPVLKADQATFAHVLRLLALLVERAGDSLEAGIREQVWTFAALTLGGPLGSNDLPKDWGKQVREATAALLRAITESDPPRELVPDHDKTSRDASSSYSTGPFQRTPALSEAIAENPESSEPAPFSLAVPPAIVSHTLTSLLLLLETPEHSTRLAALAALRSMVRLRLIPGGEMPASLPGTVSTLCKVVVATKGNSEVTVPALTCLGEAIVGCLADARGEKLGIICAGGGNESASPQLHQPASLEELFSGLTQINGVQPGALIEVDSVQDDVAVSSVDQNSISGSGHAVGKSHVWLKATVSQVHRAVLSLLPILRSHGSASVRAALGAFCGTLLLDCAKSLATAGPALPKVIQEELVILSCDEWEGVAATAGQALDSLASSEGASLQYADIACDALSSLAGSIFSNGLANESALTRDLQIVLGASQRAGCRLSTKSLKIERWSRSLLKALEMVPLQASASNAGKRDASTPWTRTNQSSLFLEAPPARQRIASAQEDGPTSQAQASLLDFPTLAFANIAPGKNVELLRKSLRWLADATARAGDASALLEHFLGLAGMPEYGDTGSARTASALWVCSQLISGLDDTRADQPRLVKDSVAIAQGWLEYGEGDISSATAVAPVLGGRSSDALLVMEDEDDAVGAPEVRRGLTADLEISYRTKQEAGGDAQTKQSTARSPTFLLNIRCLALQFLGAASRLGGRSFRSQLMHLLYPMLRSLSPSSSGGPLSAFAYTAVQHISSNCGFPSPSALVVNNVDYILNSISARLRGASLGSGFGSGAGIDPLAPSVLVCTVDLAGEAVLPHLGDAVDEIFDALDRWHAYDLLVSELLRVLDVLVNTCVTTPTSPTARPTVQQPAVNDAMQKSLDAQPNRQRDLKDFDSWFKLRHGRRNSLRREQEEQSASFNPVSAMPEVNPQVPFADLGQTAEGGDLPALDKDSLNEDDEPVEEKEDPKLSRPQALVLSILRKALHYVGHPSPFLRARVLALITTCVPLLADRSSDLLPEVSRLWPYLLARLDEAQPTSPHTPSARSGSSTPAFVTLECLRLIAVLMEYKGDFMNLRIVRDVWPRLRKVLAVLQPVRGSGSSDQYTVQHRMLREAILTMRIAVSTVPGIKNEDVWEIAITFRRFLADAWDVEIKEEVGRLLLALSKVEADMVWLVLASGAGKLSHLRCLQLPDLDGQRIDTLLDQIA